RELANAASAWRHVVGELPVTEVMAKGMAGLREGRGFIAFVACGGPQFVTLVFDCPRQFFIGQVRRWPGMKHGIRLEGELVPRNMLRPEGDRPLDIQTRRLERLAR